MGEERERQSMLLPQESRMVQVGRPDVHVPEFRKGLLGLVQRGIDRSGGKRSVHRQDHPLRTTLLRQVVVDDRDRARLIDGMNFVHLGGEGVLRHFTDPFSRQPCVATLVRQFHAGRWESDHWLWRQRRRCLRLSNGGGEN